MLDRYIPLEGASVVRINNFEIAYQATTKLFKGGRRNLLFVDIVNKMHHLNERMRGFQVAHKEL